MPALQNPTWLKAYLRATYKDTGIGVDRGKGVVNGAIVAEEGVFRDARGEFNRQSLKDTVRLMREEDRLHNGLKVRFTHPSLSDDGLGKFLGRSRNARRDVVQRPAGGGLLREVEVVRADLHFDATALDEPVGGGKPLGVYIMDLAESDPEAIGHSLVLRAREEYRLRADGTPERDEQTGEPLPPLWYPEELHAVDVVDTGDATRSFLSANLDGLPDGIVRQAARLFNEQFGTQSREFAEARCMAWLGRMLDWQFGAPPAKTATPIEDESGGVVGETYDPARDPKEWRKRLAI